MTFLLINVSDDRTATRLIDSLINQRPERVAVRSITLLAFMTDRQINNYESAAEKVKSICGFGDGEIGGCAVHFEVGKGTWYIQNHGYLDDLAAYDKLPDFLLANAQMTDGEATKPTQ